MKGSRSKFSSVAVLLAGVFFISYTKASVLPAVQECKGDQLVIKDSINIDLVSLVARAGATKGADCYWSINSDDDTRILLFSAENLLHLQEFVTIYDGLSFEEPELTLANQVQSEKSRKDLPPAVYTTGPSALMRIDYMKLLKASTTLPVSALKLRIAKAVFCPFNIGTATSCGRIVDPESCYCAVFIGKSWSDQQAFCRNKNFTLLTLDSKKEEELLVDTFGKDAFFWTGANDIGLEGIWVWDTTQQNLYPWAGGIGYANWAPGQPDTIPSDEDCMEMNFGLGWNDDVCTKLNDAICESQP